MRHYNSIPRSLFNLSVLANKAWQDFYLFWYLYRVGVHVIVMFSQPSAARIGIVSLLNYSTRTNPVLFHKYLINLIVRWNCLTVLKLMLFGRPSSCSVAEHIMWCHICLPKSRETKNIQSINHYWFGFS